MSTRSEYERVRKQYVEALDAKMEADQNVRAIGNHLGDLVLQLAEEEGDARDALT